MNKSLVFSAAGTPRPQPRPRFIHGRAVSTADRGAKLWRLAVERAATAAIEASRRARPLFTGAVKVTMVFTFVPPPSCAERLGQPHTHRPDADNLSKLVMDVMEAAGVFKNDGQVAELRPLKIWGRAPGVSVMVEDASAAVTAEVATQREGAAPGWLTAWRQPA